MALCPYAGHVLVFGEYRWETIKKWAIRNDDLSIERGELTPSLKLERSVIVDEQEDLIDSFYS